MSPSARPRETAETAPVAALVPTYNRSRMLAEALDSILAQTARPARVLVVDDGSTDDTAAVVARYEGRVEYARQENAGKPVALNTGLRLLREPLVWIFDDDDIAEPRAVETLCDALRRDEGAGFAYGLLDTFEGEWPAPVSPPLTCYAADDRKALYVQLCQDFFLWQGAMLVRREAFDAVGPFDERFTRSQDYQMALRLARRHRGVAVPEVILHQRQHPGTRGPRHAAVGADEVEDRWTRFNRLMFREIHADHALDEFVIGEDAPLSERARVTGLVQRGAIMARKGVWDLATSDTREAGEAARRLGLSALNPQERAALAVVFEHGARSWFRTTGEAMAFARATAAFGHPDLVAAVRGHLLLPITNRARLWASRPNKTAEARQIARVLAAFARPGTVRPYLDARGSPRRQRTAPLAPRAAGRGRPAA